MACHIGLAITTNLQSQICAHPDLITGTEEKGLLFRLKNSRVLPLSPFSSRSGRKVQRAMTSLKPARGLYAYSGRHKISCPQKGHPGLTWFAASHSSRKSKLGKSILYRKNLLYPGPQFMDRISSIKNSPRSSLFHHIGDLDSISQSHQTNTYHIHPLLKEDQAMEEEEEKEEEEEEEDINSQKLDQWVRDSAVEIVHNLDEAPFLVHIYCNGSGTNGDGSPPKMRIKTVKEKAIADNWPMIEERWKGGRGIPNGVILVEELKTPLGEPETSEEIVKEMDLNNQPCTSTKLWGILIQGKGKSCTACYLLKTSQLWDVFVCIPFITIAVVVRSMKPQASS
ncbi:UNVERIFIED_CONTAM: hypothetical protein Sradi_1433400 [Sesamum radiatum]|uniref:DUF7804 domain-containing protein n=1 Tax=Sesamum radiatum TaxID=300843 RepID=A0AAW2UT17_SESRA